VNRSEWLILHIANLLVCVTGVVYAVMRYVMQPVDEWSVVNHPWQPHVQHVHVLVAPLLVFAVGLIWSRHVTQKIRNGGNGRMTGVGLLVAFLPMAASGYLVQIVVNPVWHGIWIGIHVAASVLWVTAMTLHQARTWLHRRSEGRSTDPLLDSTRLLEIPRVGR